MPPDSDSFVSNWILLALSGSRDVAIDFIVRLTCLMYLTVDYYQ